MKYASDYRADARRVLENHWGLAIGATLIATLMGGSLGLGTSGGSSNGSHSNGQESGSHPSADGFSSFFNIFGSVIGQLVAAIVAVVAAVLIIYAIIRLVVGGAATLGLARFNLNLYCTGQADISDLFAYFCYFGKAFVMNFLRGLYIFLWTLCFIIPGIMASFSYAMTPFIMAENPEMDAGAAIGASKDLMYGHRWDYFCMEFSFIGWDLLCALTLGIGFIVLEPYKNAARTSFYEDLIAQRRLCAPEGPYPQAG
jgi:uncharacterized membrane protein